MDSTLEYVELCLDSWDSSSAGNTLFEGSTTNTNQIQFSWPQYFFNNKQLVISGMKVLSAEIPNVFDTVTTRNNTFVFTLAGVPTTVTIPTGTYTGATLATALQAAIVPLSAGFTVTFSSTTLRFSFNFTGGAFTWGFIFGSRNTMYSMMGFLPVSTTTMFNNGTIISPTVASVTGPYYLYLNSRSLGQCVNFNLADNAAQGSGPEIARIPINSNFGDVIFYNDPDTNKYFDFFVGNQFSSFDFYLTLGSDQYQKPLDMKGVSWSVKLGLLVYRDASGDISERPSKMFKRGGMTAIK